jgi:spermidine synthase
MLKRAIIFLFFISGFTGLVYEIVWTRIFGLIFGNTTLAISTVLSAFMLGLALGSFFIGRFADHSKVHLRLYAFLEIGVGLTAMLVPITRGIIESFSAAIYPTLINHNFVFYLIKFFIAFVLMLPATFFMGGTLPVISRFFIKQREKIGFGIGLLYAVNTFGAVIGVLLSAFYLIRIIGVNQTIYLAVFLNLAIGLIAHLFSSYYQEQPVETPETDWQLLKDPQIRMVLIIMAISGFVALSCEVVWSRVLVFVLTNSVYAFAVMLTTFLMGITIGSAVGAKFIDRIRNKLHLLGWIEILIGLTALVSAYFLANFTQIHNSLFQAESQTSWFQWNFIRFLESFLIMFPPTFLMGVAFPLASRLCIPAVSKTGTGVGFVYFFNTLGGVLGSFLTGFLFVKFFGVSVTVAIMILISISIGIYILLSIKYQTKKMLTYSFISFFIITAIIIFIYTPGTLFVNTYSTTEKGYPLIDFREGIEGTVTVHESKMPLQQNKRIDVDGLNVAGTSFMLRTLQLLQGHLPNMIQPGATNVAQIGFGTGQTSAAALLYPIKNFTLVEISRDVMEMSAKYFQDINQGVLKNPRFQYRILDGKNFIKYTPNKYDVIMNDANYAVATPSASLFTRDHFEFCREKIKPGGILSTWMTTDLDPQDFDIVLKTFQSVFPYSLLWMAPNCVNKQVVLMGSTEPITIDFREVEKNFSKPQIKDNLSDVNINSVYDLLDCLVLDSEGIQDISKDAQINSDNHPILEYSTRAIRSRDMCAVQNLAKILLRRPKLTKILVNLPEDSEAKKYVEENLRKHELASRELLQGMLAFYQGQPQKGMEILLNGSRLIPQSTLASQFFKDMDVVTTQLIVATQQNPENAEDWLRLIRQRISQSNYNEALKYLRKLKIRFTHNPLIYYESARCYLSQSKLDSAKMDLEKSLEINPGISGAWYFLGEIFRREKFPEKALHAFQKALQFDPQLYEALNGSAAVYKSQGNYAKAASLLHQSLEEMEYQPETAAEFGDCYLKMKQYPEAIKQYKSAMIMGNSSPRVLFNLGNAFFLSGQLKEAEKWFRNVLVIDENNSEIYYNLGNLNTVQNQFELAIPLYKKAISLNKNEPDYFNNLAMCYRQTGQTHEALSVFDEGLKLFPDSPLLVKNAEETKRSLTKSSLKK